MLIYADAEWYQARPEPERTWTGQLDERRAGVGPEGRGGLRYVLITDLGGLSLYAATAERELAGCVGSTVRVRGKLVDLTVEGGGRELWPASIEVEEPAPP